MQAVKVRVLSSHCHGNKVHMTGMGICPMCVLYRFNREEKGRRTVELKSDGILF